MSYTIKFKEKAIKLRKQGYSLKEIAEKLTTAKSTASLWLRSVELDNRAKGRLKERKILGQYKSMILWKKKREKRDLLLGEKALSIIKKIEFNRDLNKLFCSVLFWAEGTKNFQRLSFTNSDPSMIVSFLGLMRSSFYLDETKFRALVHIHDYHDDQQIKKFWSDLTKIPLVQFSRSYQKPHTKKRARQGYKGSIRIVYYDSKIARELHALYNTFSMYLGA